jgi:hypothetical protein
MPGREGRGEGMSTYRRAIDWLLEPADPGVRYLALRDLAAASPSELKTARDGAHLRGPIAAVVSSMNGDRYWEVPGPGYNPKYTSTVWSLILLSQLGAHATEDKRIGLACRRYLDEAFTAHGIITAGGGPSGTADCLQGNMLAALLDLGVDDPRLDLAFDWMARSVTGEGVAPVTDKKAGVRYYAGKCGPVFACGANNKLPCAWGAVKVMLAFGKLPVAKRTPLIGRAIATGVDFLFSKDPADADYPCGYAARPSGNWWKFGFPVFYVTDLLQNVEALVALGYRGHPRLARALDLVLGKADAEGRWALDYDYAGKTWVDFGARKAPNKWVTWRALRVLREPWSGPSTPSS